uniref:Uncharacterized protein n=1 Tax=Anguilla anguilla TaxID=7936 RepID=A0A0E9R9G9_ANGAN
MQNPPGALTLYCTAVLQSPLLR